MDIKSRDSVVPVISVILPVFNTEKYVSEAVQSILNQSFRNFEFIIINDGSTDGTYKVLQQLGKLDKRINLITRENRGIAATMNEGIRIASGKWIAIMNADDIALSNRFELQLQWLEQTGADICGSWVRFIGASDARILKHPQSDEAIKVGLLFGCVFAQPTVMMRSALVKELLYDTSWKVAEDYDLWERATHMGWKMTNVPEALLLYRLHQNQISVSEFTYADELTQKIRSRYWYYLFSELKLNAVWVDEVMKLRALPLRKPNMDHVDGAFRELLMRHHGEARATIFDHMTRLYFRAAALCPDIAFRWARLNEEFGTESAIKTKCTLFLMSVFRVKPDAKAFSFLKNIRNRWLA